MKSFQVLKVIYIALTRGLGFPSIDHLGVLLAEDSRGVVLGIQGMSYQLTLFICKIKGWGDRETLA
jgi:hypothetical protein